VFAYKELNQDCDVFAYKERNQGCDVFAYKELYQDCDVFAYKASCEHTINETLLSDTSVEKARAMRPMTKKEWEKKQSVLRHVYDPETGRER